LNYAPESINTQFDIEVSGISFTLQLTIIATIIVILISIFLKNSLKSVGIYYKNLDQGIESGEKLISKIRKDCLNLPYRMFLVQTIIPVFGALLVLIFTGSHMYIMIVKILLMIVSFVLLIATLSFIFTRGIFSRILIKTYDENVEDKGIRVSITQRVFLQIFSICIISVLFTILVGYSRVAAKQGDIMFGFYNIELDRFFEKVKIYTEKEIIKELETFRKYDEADTKFIIKSNGEVETDNGTKLSDFFIKYTKEKAMAYNGRTYDSYGVDIQGSVVEVKTVDGIDLVGVMYSTASADTLVIFVVGFIILLDIIVVSLYYFSKAMSKDIERIATQLSKISETDNVDFNQKIAVQSNDEIADLTIAFNKIQNLTKHNIEKIRESQDILMERERLASLGQMVGGISHNLKTPIMSISGAMEGMRDLISEYSKSIEDKEVTISDHHEIAKDMLNWVEKVKSYTAYMSDVITTVKGQAVAFSDQGVFEFTIGELVNKVDILMQHDLDVAQVTLKTELYVSESTRVTGNINSLIQVIDNLISNSIQAYAGNSGVINCKIYMDENNLVIGVNEKAGGMDPEILDKLLKEMVTTKGKNGTGLGLFMSASNIRAQFNGTLTFENEPGVGVEFNITIPL
jgi:signal transduction histidine kinase